MTDNYFSISIYLDSLGYQVSVYNVGLDESIWCEDLFRTFNDDEHADSHAKAREYAEALYRDLKSESVDVLLDDEPEL